MLAAYVLYGEEGAIDAGAQAKPQAGAEGVARFVTEDLVSSGTTHGIPLYVQGGALIASKRAKRLTANGYLAAKPPDFCGDMLS